MTWDIARSRLNAASVLVRIGTDDFHVHRSETSPIRDGSPRLSRERPRVHTVRDHNPTKPQVVLCDHVRHFVAFPFDRPS